MLRYYLTLLIFLFPVMLSAQQRGLTVEAAAGNEEIAGTKFAILIGVNDYAQIRPLRYAKNDTEALRDQLLAIGFEPRNVTTLVCGGATRYLPTKHNIETVIRGILNLAREGDFVLISMSGHGIEIDGEARFCPLDTNPREIASTTIPIKNIFGELEQSKATLKLMIVDACRDNPFLSRSLYGTSVLQTIANPPPGVMLLQSSSPGEESFESAELRRGIFTHYLVEGLGGRAANADGKVTFFGLFNFASEATQRRALSQHRAVQRPRLLGDVTNFVLSSDPHRALREQVQADFRRFAKERNDGGSMMDFLARQSLPQLKQAAELGVPEGQVLYGACLIFGVGVSENGVEAARWLRKAAEQGNWFAQFMLAGCYVDGIGVSENEVEAARWFRKAAEQGDSESQSILGFFYEEGIGVTKNVNEAVRWYRKAAEQGFPAGQTALGTCYENGIGVTRNVNEAIRWYRLAAAQEDDEAREALRRLGAR